MPYMGIKVQVYFPKQLESMSVGKEYNYDIYPMYKIFIFPYFYMLIFSNTILIC